jgi:hypothetical protein
MAASPPRFAQAYFKRKYADLVDEAEELIRTARTSIGLHAEKQCCWVGATVKDWRNAADRPDVVARKDCSVRPRRLLARIFVRR